MSDQEKDRDRPGHDFRVDKPHPASEIYQAFPDEPLAVGMSPTDGLAQVRPPASIQMAMAPPLALDTFVCMADTSEFVVRNRLNEILFRFPPERVKRLRGGGYVVEVDAGDAICAELADHRIRLSRVPGVERKFELMVEPLRPQCKHFTRQLCDFPDDNEHQVIVRICTARREESGDPLSLSNTQIFACELRDPPDLETAHLLDEADRRIIAEGKARRDQQAEFDVSAALGKGPDADELGGGIFSDKV